MNKALGLIEVLGLTTAMAALDAALKAADVQFLGCEKVIGVGKAIGLTVRFEGDVASVQSALDAAKVAAERIGKVFVARVIARPDVELNRLWSRCQN